MTSETIPATFAHLVLLRLPQVSARTGLSRSELYRRIAIGSFPAPIKIGARASAWSSLEIERWIAEDGDRRMAAARIEERHRAEPREALLPITPRIAGDRPPRPRDATAALGWSSRP